MEIITKWRRIEGIPKTHGRGSIEDFFLLISPDESRAYAGFMLVTLPPPYTLTCVCDNS